MTCGATKLIKESYHHGDLRRALLAVGLARVRSAGMHSFSLREAARDVGVTSGAVYKHFVDREALLAGVAATGFSMLAQQTLDATTQLRGKARLLATGLAYVDFASAEPNLFRLMFSHPGPARAEGSPRAGPPLSSADGAAPRAFDQLRDAVADARGIDSAAVDDEILALAWSVAHGAACLISDGVWQERDARAIAALRQAVKLVDLPER